MLAGTTSVFDRSGLASLSDFQSPEWALLFGRMEEEQRVFLASESHFRSEAYMKKWPSDALHWWSRVWEYPYVFHHITQRLQANDGESTPTVVDFGSGVTFFPFSVAKWRAKVIAVDVDEACRDDIGKAARIFQVSPGEVSFRMSEGNILPFGDSEVDIVYSVSVLEHIPDFGNSIQEIARILKPGGLFVLTIDLDLLGNSEIGANRYKTLVRTIEENFSYFCPDRTVHPADFLDSRRGPQPMQPMTLSRFAFELAKNYIVKPMIGRKPRKVYRRNWLAVQGFCLVRKQR